MTVAVAAAREAPSFSPGREVELLRSALDQELLAELGWDPEAIVVRAVLGHPSFGFAMCEVSGCELPGSTGGTSALPATTGSPRRWRLVAAATWSSSSGSRESRRGGCRSESAGCAACRPITCGRLWRTGCAALTTDGADISG